jgi:uncharacterized Zn-binding protein involved in type VI secretion
MRKVIRLGDSTSHGGKVISTRATNFKVGGIPVACVCDASSLPKTGQIKSNNASGYSRHRIKGVSIAFADDVTSCGAKLNSSLQNFSTS